MSSLTRKIEVGTDVEKIMGSPWLNVVQLLLLMAKHQTDCVFMPVVITPATIRYEATHSDFIYQFIWDEETKTLKPPFALGDDWISKLRECVEGSSRFVVIPLSMFIYKMSGSELRRYGHSNSLLYDKKLGVLERYEPNGKSTPEGFDINSMNKALKEMFGQIFGINVTVVSPEEYCPQKGPQYIEEITRKEYDSPMTKGTCTLWSFVYIDYRLTYPDMSRDEIHDFIHRQIMSKSSDLYAFIVDYLKTLVGVSKMLLSAASEDEIISVLISNSIQR
jgi:hypothetical protein